ncbi:MAG: M48 family metalloprotease [Fimbriimonadaceae bacterium]|nr:M48 family metalloprotease [Chitinophagales bacterium]
MNKTTLCLSLLCISVSCFSQTIDFNQYEGLYSYGQVPEDFTKLSSEKYLEDMEKMNTNNTSEQNLKSADNYYLQSNFITDEILHNGRVVFGDPVTNYLNEIKSELLKGFPDLNNAIRIYTFKSKEVNAFTFGNGIVLVSTGLMAQVKNEAQLAFILCHEFEHYIEKHSFTSYVESTKRSRGDGAYKNLNKVALEMERYKYSKDLEGAADLKAVELFKKSKYSINAVEGAFTMLLYSYLPYANNPFNLKFFNYGSFRIPKGYFLDSTKAISAEEDYNDRTSTHPNIKKRKQSTLEALGDVGQFDRKDFQVSEENFQYVQKICRYENVKIYLNERNYEYAFYINYLLMLEDPGNPTLQKNMAKALYGISVYKTARSYNAEIHSSWRKTEGSVQQIYYMAERIPAKDFSILALAKIWPVYKQNMQDKTLEKMCDELMYDVLKEHRVKLKDFKTAHLAGADTLMLDLSLQPADTLSVKEKEKLTKKNKKTPPVVTETKSGENAYWKFAFVELLKDELFLKKMQQRENDKSPEEIAGKRGYNSKRDEFALGLNKAIVVDPVYIKVDERTNIPINYIESEQSRLSISQTIEECADTLELQIQFISNINKESSDVLEFNHIAMLNDWMAEKIAHLGSEVDILNSNQEEFKALSRHYDIEDFMWIGVLAITEKESGIVLKIINTLLIAPIPFVIYDLLTKDRYTYFFSIVANANTDTIDMVYFNGTALEDKEALQKSNIYYILLQMKN